MPRDAVSAEGDPYAVENSEALRRAHAVAQWEIGDATWADVILNAYFDPDDLSAAEALEELTKP